MLPGAFALFLWAFISGQSLIEEQKPLWQEQKHELVLQRWSKLIGSLCSWLTSLHFECFPAKQYLVFVRIFCENKTLFLICAAWKHPFNLKDKEYRLAPICAPISLLWLYCVTLYHDMVCVCTSSQISSVYRDFLCIECQYNTWYAQYHIKFTDEEISSSPIGILYWFGTKTPLFSSCLCHCRRPTSVTGKSQSSSLSCRDGRILNNSFYSLNKKNGG